MIHHKYEDKYFPNENIVNQGMNMNFIITLTSYGQRLLTIHFCLESIFSQSFIPDKIILNLHEHEIIHDNIVPYLSKGLIINRFSHDYHSHNKYLYVMREYPNDTIITLDDDVVYPNDLLKLLIDSYIKYPKAISAGRVHGIRLDNSGNLLSYTKWCWEQKLYETPSMHLFATGVGGVLYPSNCMHKDVLDGNKINSLCLYSDDVWLKFMQVLNATPVVQIKQTVQHPKSISGLVGEKLYIKNKLEGRNDQYLKYLTEIYKIDWKKVLNHE